MQGSRANRIRSDAFLVLPHYPLFAVTMETVETNFRWRGVESPGCSCSLLHRWDFSGFASEPSDLGHFLHAPHTMQTERINVQSPSVTILCVKLDDELERSVEIGRGFEAVMSPNTMRKHRMGRKSVTGVTDYSRYFLFAERRVRCGSR
jgi:hypothetical protein